MTESSEDTGNPPEINADLLLKAYMCGVFPMAETRASDSLYWVDPKKRGIIPLDRFHLPTRLKKQLIKRPFRVTVDNAFPQVMRACAAPRSGQDESWINDQILELYEELFRRGFAHSVECWNDSGELVGGLYGVCIAGAYFGESMFHTETDASKIALCHLVARLKHGGFSLLDTQFVTDHLKQFGAVEIKREDYHNMLEHALGQQDADFYSMGSSSFKSISTSTMSSSKPFA